MADPILSRKNPGTLRDLTAAALGPAAVSEYDAQRTFDAAKELYITARMRDIPPLPTAENLTALKTACREAYLALWAACGEPSRTPPEWLS